MEEGSQPLLQEMPPALLLQELRLMMILPPVVHHLRGRPGGACCVWRCLLHLPSLLQEGWPVPQVRERRQAHRRPAAATTAAAAAAAVVTTAAAG